MTRLVSVRVVCDGCRSAAAVVYCVGVRRALCSLCSRGQAGHEQVELGRTVASLPFCEQCDVAPAEVYCTVEDAALCMQCDSAVHDGTAFLRHDRCGIRATLVQRPVRFFGDVRPVRGESPRNTDVQKAFRDANRGDLLAVDRKPVQRLRRGRQSGPIQRRISDSETYIRSRSGNETDAKKMLSTRKSKKRSPRQQLDVQSASPNVAELSRLGCHPASVAQPQVKYDLHMSGSGISETEIAVVPKNTAMRYVTDSNEKMPTSAGSMSDKCCGQPSGIGCPENVRRCNDIFGIQSNFPEAQPTAAFTKPSILSSGGRRTPETEQCLQQFAQVQPGSMNFPCDPAQDGSLVAFPSCQNGSRTASDRKMTEFTVMELAQKPPTNGALPLCKKTVPNAASGTNASEVACSLQSDLSSITKMSSPKHQSKLPVRHVASGLIGNCITSTCAFSGNAGNPCVEPGLNRPCHQASRADLETPRQYLGNNAGSSWFSGNTLDSFTMRENSEVEELLTAPEKPIIVSKHSVDAVSNDPENCPSFPLQKGTSQNGRDLASQPRSNNLTRSVNFAASLNDHVTETEAQDAKDTLQHRGHGAERIRELSGMHLQHSELHMAMGCTPAVGSNYLLTTAGYITSEALDDNPRSVRCSKSTSLSTSGSSSGSLPDESVPMVPSVTVAAAAAAAAAAAGEQYLLTAAELEKASPGTQPMNAAELHSAAATAAFQAASFTCKANHENSKKRDRQHRESSTEKSRDPARTNAPEAHESCATVEMSLTNSISSKRELDRRKSSAKLEKLAPTSCADIITGMSVSDNATGSSRHPTCQNAGITPLPHVELNSHMCEDDVEIPDLGGIEALDLSQFESCSGITSTSDDKDVKILDHFGE